MQKTKRRDFLKATVSTAVAMVSPWPFTTCRGSAQEASPESYETIARGTAVPAAKGSDQIV
jgi:hypothetical protein